jgi:hypothetical protein
MVMKPKLALHLMMTMMGLFIPMIDKKIAKARADAPAVAPEFPVALTPSRAA